MKEGIHPEFFPEAKIVCSCGNSWVAGSTKSEVHTDVCSQCHPFFTGERRIVDSAGRVDRFLRKLEWRDQVIAEEEKRKAEVTSPARALAELDLGSRVLGVLAGAGLRTVGDVIDKLEQGDDSLTELKGFGLKSLADLKKAMRSRGFILPGDDVPEDKTPEEAVAVVD